MLDSNQPFSLNSAILAASIALYYLLYTYNEIHIVIRYTIDILKTIDRRMNKTRICDLFISAT